MEDQGKRLLLAVGLITIVFLVYTQFFAPKPQPAPEGGQATSAPEATAPAAPGAPVTPVATAPAPAAEACDPTKDGDLGWKNDQVTVRFSRCGGALASFQLEGEQYRDRTAGKKGGMNLVRTRENPAWYPLQAQVEVPQTAGSVDPSEARRPIIPANATWEVEKQTDKEITFRWSSAEQGIEVRRTWRRGDMPWALFLDTEVKNILPAGGGKRLVALDLAIYGYQDPNAKEGGMFSYAAPAWAAACYSDGELHHDKPKELTTDPRRRTGTVKWAGAEHKYFLLAAAPLDAEPVACSAAQVPVAAGTKSGVFRTELEQSTPAALDPGQALRRQTVVYVGPKTLEHLEGLEKQLKKELALSESVDLGWFGFIARPMLALLKLFYSWAGNWGIAIILLTITVKLLTLYWTHKSMKSMKAMGKLKPKMEELQKKYAEDKQRLQTEMMNLYRTHNINPLGGCLPILLQMPIWFALYQTLGAASELYQAPFVLWIDDLTAPDRYYVVPGAVTALMFLQARIAPAAVDSAQQKMMMYMMPIMFGVFSLFFPSGLGVYILTNTVLGMAHQIYLNKTDQPLPAPVVKEEPPAPVAKVGGDGPAKRSKKAAKRAAKA